MILKGGRVANYELSIHLSSFIEKFNKWNDDFHGYMDITGCSTAPCTRPSVVLTASVEMTCEQIKELLLIHQLSLILKRMTPMCIF